MSLDRAELRRRYCWWAGDSVTGCEDVTRFRRRARAHQCHWREERGVEMGYLRRGDRTYPNGAKMDPVEDNKRKNFLDSDAIVNAVQHRLDPRSRETHETIQTDRLWFDLLSSMPMCFNLFGEIWRDGARSASEAVTRLWDCEPGQPVEVKFEHSPGRTNAEYAGDRTAFDAALFVGAPTGPRTVIGIETKYHECALAEPPPDTDTRLPRYLEIVEESAIFQPGWRRAVIGTPLQQVWRDHLLLLSMLQQPGAWSGGRYVLVHPQGNPAFRNLGEQYREQVLEDDSTFQVFTIEELVNAGVLHTPETEERFRYRYLFDDCPSCDADDPAGVG